VLKTLWLSLMACLAMAMAPLAHAAPAADGPVAFTLSPDVGPKGLEALKVEVRFAGDASGRTRFAWLKTWAGDEQLYSRARDFKVSGGQAQPDGPGAWIIRAAPHAPIIVSYRVLSAYDHDPTVDDTAQSKPVIRPDWFFATGEGLFARPEGRDKAPASFAWTGAPRGFAFASDLEHLRSPGGRAARPGVVDDVLESVSIGGRALHVTQRRIDGAPVRVATVGRYGFEAATFTDQVFEVLAAERAFWGVPATPFLVAMSPIAAAPHRYSLSGAGRGDGFALWVDDTNAKLADLRWLLAHEYFHTWNPAQLGGTGAEDVEPLEYWFSEGFTDYYARKLMWTSHQFSSGEFAAKWNEVLRAYAASPVRAAPNSRIQAEFWSSGQVQKLPYQRGAMLAAVLDRQAQSRGSSLDAVMREMRRRAARPGPPHADELFPVVYREITGLDASALIARHMIAGEPISLPADTFGPCFRVETGEAPTKTGVITRQQLVVVEAAARCGP